MQGGPLSSQIRSLYWADTLGSGGGVVEAARARVRCAWAK